LGRSSDAFDYQGILTHEFGHLTGLADNFVLDFTKEVQTMYGYASPTSKVVNGVYYIESYQLRSIEADDIAGKNALWN